MRPKSSLQYGSTTWKREGAGDKCSPVSHMHVTEQGWARQQVQANVREPSYKVRPQLKESGASRPVTHAAY